MVNKQLQYTYYPSKGNQTMEFAQVIENKKVNVLFFKNHAENEAGSSRPLFVF